MEGRAEAWAETSEPIDEGNLSQVSGRAASELRTEVGHMPTRKSLPVRPPPLGLAEYTSGGEEHESEAFRSAERKKAFVVEEHGLISVRD